MFAIFYGYTPWETLNLTFSDAILLASNAVNQYMIEERRNIYYPTMADKTSSRRFIREQKREIRDGAQRYWDLMFPRLPESHEKALKKYGLGG